MNIRNALKITTAALALVGSMSMAHAADLAVAPVEPAAPIPYAFSWTGFYVGANVGYGFAGDDKVGTNITGFGYVTDIDKLELSGVFGGGQVGYNYQMGEFVFGLEADIQVAGVDDDFSTVIAGRGAPIDGTLVDAKSDVNWFGTVRPRVGFAWDRALIYATGGLAFGGVDYSVKSTGGIYGAGAVSMDNDDTLVGWTAGAGVEYAFTDNLTAKLEYKYVNFGSQTVSGFVVGGPLDGTKVSTKETPDFHSVLIGINYKF